MKIFTSLVSSLLLLLSLGRLAKAQETTLNPDVALRLAKFGTTIFTGAYDLISTQQERSSQPTDANAVFNDLRKLGDKYTLSVKQVAYSADLLQSNFDVLITVGQVAGTASGVGAIPSALVGRIPGARWANGQFAGKIRQQGQADAQALLAKNLADIGDSKMAEIKNLLQINKPVDAAQLYESYTHGLSALRTCMKDHQADNGEAAGLAQDLLMNTLNETTIESLKLGGQNAIQIGQLQQQFASYSVFTTKFATEANSRVETSKLGCETKW